MKKKKRLPRKVKKAMKKIIRFSENAHRVIGNYVYYHRAELTAYDVFMGRTLSPERLLFL